jgi:nitrite reductase (NADH) large subunit
VPRIGLDRLKEVLLEDSEGMVADLDEGIQRSIDAYSDPWGQDAKQSATSGQFRPSLPLIDLPKVPVGSAPKASGSAPEVGR